MVVRDNHRGLFEKAERLKRLCSDSWMTLDGGIRLRIHVSGVRNEVPRERQEADVVEEGGERQVVYGVARQTYERANGPSQRSGSSSMSSLAGESTIQLSRRLPYQNTFNIPTG
jgi:hypothetical protein